MAAGLIPRIARQLGSSPSCLCSLPLERWHVQNLEATQSVGSVAVFDKSQHVLLGQDVQKTEKGSGLRDARED